MIKNAQKMAFKINRNGKCSGKIDEDINEDINEYIAIYEEADLENNLNSKQKLSYLYNLFWRKKHGFTVAMFNLFVVRSKRPV